MLKIYDSSLDLQVILSEEEYWDDIIEESINKEYYLTFTTIIDGDKSEYIANDNIVEADGNYFQIVYFQKQRTSSGELLIQVEAWQVAMDLNDPVYNLDTFTEDDTPTNILTTILDGTDFTVGTVGFMDVTTFSIQEKSSRRDILIQFAEYLGGELKFNKYEISLLSSRGADNGVQFRVGKNLLGITKDVDKRSGTLQTAYDIDMVELRTLPEFGDMEAVELGDTIKIIDSDIGVDEKQRIVTYAYSPKLRISSRVVIANHLDGIEDTLFRIQRTTIVKEKVYNGIKIGPEDGFEAIRSDNKARTVMNATEGIKIQQGDGTGNVWTDVIYLDVNGNAVFEGTVQASDFIGGTINIGTGAFTVDNTGNVAITTGSINLGSGVFTVDNAGNMVATSGTFTGTITGSDIIGGTITGALIQTAETGRRLALEGSELQSLDTNTNDGFTLDGSDGFLRWYNAGLQTGLIGRDTSQPYEQFLLSHDYLLLSGTIGIDLPSASITIGNVGGNIYMVGNTSFSGTTVTGLITNTIVDHNHGVTPGRYIMTYDSGGLELGLQLWSASGGHGHTVLAS